MQQFNEELFKDYLISIISLTITPKEGEDVGMLAMEAIDNLTPFELVVHLGNYLTKPNWR